MQPLSADRSFPAEFSDNPTETMKSFTGGLDSLLKSRLPELSQVQGAYLSTLVRQLRLLLSSKSDTVKSDSDKVLQKVIKVQDKLEGQRHNP